MVDRDWGGAYAFTAARTLPQLPRFAFAFPLYWALVTTLKPEMEVVEPGFRLWPREFTIEAYAFVLTNSKILIWYMNSIVTSTAVTVLVIASGVLCGYAISQLEFPGRKLIFYMILGSFMVPISALIVNHFLLVFRLGLLDTWAGIVLPQLIHPVVIIIYKQFFDAVPKEFREAASWPSINLQCMRFIRPSTRSATASVLLSICRCGLPRRNMLERSNCALSR